MLLRVTAIKKTTLLKFTANEKNTLLKVTAIEKTTLLKFTADKKNTLLRITAIKKTIPVKIELFKKKFGVTCVYTGARLLKKVSRKTNAR